MCERSNGIICRQLAPSSDCLLNFIRSKWMTSRQGLPFPTCLWKAHEDEDQLSSRTDQETLKLIVIPLRVFRWTVVISRGLVFKVDKHCKLTFPYRIKVTNRITLCASRLEIKLPSNSFPFFPCFNFQNVKTQYREPGLCLVTPGNDTLLIAPPGS